MLKDQIADIPRKPGVYLFLDKSGKVLYIGKAKNLHSRVSQYFGTSDNRAQLPFLIAEAHSIDYTVVNSELESLFLENTLIKEYLPPYNIKLRDDKNFAFIKIDYTTQIPQITYSRSVDETLSRKTQAKYFGPYSSTAKIRKTLDIVRKIFPYCANKTVGSKPCFYYFLHRCPGVCIGQISLQEYKLHLENIVQFLSGHTSDIKKQIRNTMLANAKKKQFEIAGRLRDQLQNLQVLEEKQMAVFPKKVSWDLVSLYKDGLSACINIFKVREGKLLDKENFIYDNILAPENQRLSNEILQKFLEQYYSQTTDLPSEILTQFNPVNVALLRQLLTSRHKQLRTKPRKIKLICPQRGEKKKLLKLGTLNAQEFLQKWRANQGISLDQINLALSLLAEVLKLPQTPRRIEGYDISNIQGTNPVGSMVVMKNGIPAKSEYRKFKITSKQTPDDFRMMEEMLSRRVARILNKTQTDPWPTPDLIVIDGGKGQLKVADKILKDAKLKIPVIGLAKRIEEIFLPNQSTPIVLPHNNPALQLLQRLRDEAHRFGITFHRNLRSKQALKSVLDEVPGIGPKTKKLLKQKIGTIEKIKLVSLEQLRATIGTSKADILYKALH